MAKPRTLASADAGRYEIRLVPAGPTYPVVAFGAENNGDPVVGYIDPSGEMLFEDSYDELIALPPPPPPPPVMRRIDWFAAHIIGGFAANQQFLDKMAYHQSQFGPDAEQTLVEVVYRLATELEAEAGLN